MGTLNFSLGKYSQSPSRTILGTQVTASDAFSTSTSATNVEASSVDISAKAGQVFRCVIDEPAWIAFGGRTATVGNDFYMKADTEYEWEIDPSDAGTISVIDVS